MSFTDLTGAPALRLRNISKRFGKLLANDAMSLEVAPGEVLALLGENGAGKSTLVSILFGHYVADSGTIEAFGKPLPPGDPRAALAAGIGIVHQHFALADNLSVLDNVLLGTEPLHWLFSKRGAARARLHATATQFGLQVDPQANVGSLSVGQKQRVEILKALYRGARLLILDEPTAVLTPQESEALFATLKTLVAQGMSIIFISHKLAEVLRVSDRVAVLRGGKLVALADAKTSSTQQLAQWMVGHAMPDVVTSSATSQSRQLPEEARPAPVCTLHRVSAALNLRERLTDASLRFYAGQITAIAGVSGNGQQALAALLSGTLRPQAGAVTLHNQPAPLSPTAWTNAGVARIPEDRKGTGVIADLPFWENAVSERLRSHFSRWGFIRKRAARAYAASLVQRFDIRGDLAGDGLNHAVSGLSGGNMQKLILGRSLHAPDGKPPRLIVAHQPTWGLDVGAVAYIHAQLRAARNAGAAVLLISDDLDEIMALADVLAVIQGGRLTATRPTADWSRAAIGLAMAGHAANPIAAHQMELAHAA